MRRRHRDREKEQQKDRETKRQCDGETEKQRDSQTENQRIRKIERQRNKAKKLNRERKSLSGYVCDHVQSFNSVCNIYIYHTSCANRKHVKTNLN